MFLLDVCLCATIILAKTTLRFTKNNVDFAKLVANLKTKFWLTIGFQISDWSSLKKTMYLHFTNYNAYFKSKNVQT